MYRKEGQGRNILHRHPDQLVLNIYSAIESSQNVSGVSHPAGFVQVIRV